MILLLKEEDRDNDSNTTLPDAKMICDRLTIFGCPDRMSDNQEFHLVSKELLEEQVVLSSSVNTFISILIPTDDSLVGRSNR
jgi:hypothetical protein